MLKTHISIIKQIKINENSNSNNNINNNENDSVEWIENENGKKKEGNLIKNRDYYIYFNDIKIGEVALLNWNVTRKESLNCMANIKVESLTHKIDNTPSELLSTFNKLNQRLE